MDQFFPRMATFTKSVSLPSQPALVGTRLANQASPANCGRGVPLKVSKGMSQILRPATWLMACVIATTGWIAVAEAAPEQQRQRASQRTAAPVKRNVEQRVVRRPVAKAPTSERRQIRQAERPTKTVQARPVVTKKFEERKPEKTQAKIEKPKQVPVAKVVTPIKPIIKPATNVQAIKTAPLVLPKGKAMALGVGAGLAAAAIAKANAAPAPQKPVLESKLTAPFKSKFVQTGIKTAPVSQPKPSFIKHNPNMLAGVKGLKTGYLPFWFNHGGARWYRSYYTVAVGGIWYWYWCNTPAIYAPVPVVVIVDADVISCDPDDDDCGLDY